MRLAIDGGTPLLPDLSTTAWPRISVEQLALVETLLRKGEISYYGREGLVEDLEAYWSDRLDHSDCLAVSSGTAALHSAYFALGAEHGDEVIVPTNTFLATVMPVVACGATPVLVDAEGDTGNIDPELVEMAITDRTVGVAVTHLWGHPADMIALNRICVKHGLWLLEDCSHAHGATHPTEGASLPSEVGTHGDAAAFSFQAAKMVFAGQGGLLATRRKDVYERAVLFGHFRARSQQDGGTLKRFASTGFGLNYRMHPLAAALALTSSNDLDTRIECRTRLQNHLVSRLKMIPGIEPPVTRPGYTRGAFYGFKVRLSERWREIDRRTLAEAFRLEGLDVSVPGSEPLHTLPFFTEGSAPVFRRTDNSRHRYQRGDLPVSEAIWESSLSLPTFAFEDEAWLVDKYADGFEKVFANLDRLAQLQP
jgi:perosamine synthetase